MLNRAANWATILSFGSVTVGPILKIIKEQIGMIDLVMYLSAIVCVASLFLTNWLQDKKIKDLERLKNIHIHDRNLAGDAIKILFDKNKDSLSAEEKEKMNDLLKLLRMRP